MAKKIAGYFFMTLSVLLGISVLAQLRRIISSLIGIIKALTGNVDAYDTSYAISSVLGYLALGYGVFLLWTYGKKLTKGTQMHPKADDEKHFPTR